MDPRSASSSRSALSWGPTLTDPESRAPHAERTLRIEIQVASDEELRALRGALLTARASELSEIQRRSQRHGLGYGTESARESMTDEVTSLRRRWTMLDRLLAAIDSAEPAG